MGSVFKSWTVSLISFNVYELYVNIFFYIYSDIYLLLFLLSSHLLMLSLSCFVFAFKLIKYFDEIYDCSR